MSPKSILRIISGVMLVVAIVFVTIAVQSPTMGTAIYIGNFRFGAEEWRVCYLLYLILMVALFLVSFFVKGKKKRTLDGMDRAIANFKKGEVSEPIDLSDFEED